MSHDSSSGTEPANLTKNLTKVSESDWILVEKINMDDVLFLKKSVSTLVRNFNIESCKHNKSTKGENAKQYDLFNYLHDPRYGIQLLNKIKFEIQKSLVRENKMDTHKQLNLKSAWTVLGYENSFHTIHRHNQRACNHIATIIYLSVPEVVDSIRSGAFYAILQDSDKENFNFIHFPKVGDILIFPNWVYHGTEPQAIGLRQTLNLDFEIV